MISSFVYPKGRRRLQPLRTLILLILVGILAFTSAAPALAAPPSPNTPEAQNELYLMRKLTKHGSSAIVYAEICHKVTVHPELAALCASIHGRHRNQQFMFRDWSWVWYWERLNIDKRDRMIVRRFGGRYFRESFEQQAMTLLSQHLKSGLSLAQSCSTQAVHTELRDACLVRYADDQAAAAQIDAWLAAWY